MPALRKGGTLTEEMYYKIMRLFADNPETSQRDAARELGISLGKVNYCIRALIRKGWVKASHFKNSNNKAAYLYLLTPHGLEQRAKLTMRFLQIRLREYETLRIEIEQIRQEAARHRLR